MIPRAILALLAFGFFGLFADAQTPASPDAATDTLVRKLSSPVFAERERARRELEAIGIPALERLRNARKPADREGQCRLAELIRRAEEQLLTQQILAPKEVHLDIKDATLDEALAELSRVGYPVQFQGDRMVLAKKSITLDTGKTSFWQALDRLCEEAGLMEKIDAEVARAPQQAKTGKKGRIVSAVGRDVQTTVGPIVLTNRSNQKTYTSYAGAVKSQLRVSRDAAANEFVLHFAVSIEPRILNGMLAGRPTLERSLGERGIKLVEATPAANTLPVAAGIANDIAWAVGGAAVSRSQRTTEVRIKDDANASNRLAELAGKLSLQVDLANETVARIKNALDAAGKSAEGANGGSLRIDGVRRTGDDIEVQVSMINLIPNPFGNNVIINGGNIIIRGNIQGGIVIGAGGVRVGGQNLNGARPDLIDAKGQKFQVVSVNTTGTAINNGTVSTSATIRYRPNPGQAAASELILYGTRTQMIAVPFRFENVPLP